MQESHRNMKWQHIGGSGGISPSSEMAGRDAVERWWDPAAERRCGETKRRD